MHPFPIKHGKLYILFLENNIPQQIKQPLVNDAELVLYSHLPITELKFVYFIFQEFSLSEVVIPGLLMLILGLIHSQTVLSHISHRTLLHRDGKHMSRQELNFFFNFATLPCNVAEMEILQPENGDVYSRCDVLCDCSLI